jgi:hypothetical protein
MLDDLVAEEYAGQGEEEGPYSPLPAAVTSDGNEELTWYGCGGESE